ncbi:MAG TPA: prepilin peptidase [Chloroflexi bacterium]|jgi:leader peptidase (prepilin peptidase)/N-methyltransferase|nr:prepilin peptidase [Chloroflexota bacterium]
MATIWIWRVAHGLLGLVVGSFLNVVADRVPEKQSLLRPPSHCPKCGRRLAVRDLIPVVSYLWLRGRCRSCGEPIPPRVLLVELATGALFFFLAIVYGFSFELLLPSVYTAILVVIVTIDLERHIIPNAIVLPSILFALLAAVGGIWLSTPTFGRYGFLWGLAASRGEVALSPAQMGAISQVLGGVTAFGIFFILWIISPGGIGAGDVKLAGFAGLVTAFPLAIATVFGSFILGGVVSAVLLITRLATRKTAIPFAPFIAVTTFVIMVYGDSLLRWYLMR